MFRSTLAAAALLLPGAAAADPALDAIEVEFVRLINEYRATAGLRCLSVSPTMNVASDYMSRTMGEQRFFAHEEPPCTEAGCTGRDPFERITDFGHVNWGTAGENIAAGSDTAKAVFNGWRNSPGHNANMLEPSFRAMGIARAEVPGSPYGIYWTNNFSDHADGSHRCEDGLPPVGYGAGSGGSGGDGGSGGSGGSGEPACVEPGEGGAGGDDGWGIGRPAEPDERCADANGGGGGCASAGGLSLLAFAAVALRLRRR